MRIRRELLRIFLDFAAREHLTFYRIATVCRTSKPRAWNLLHGRIELFNSETLIDMLAQFGFTIDVRVTSWRRVTIFGPDGVVARDRERVSGRPRDRAWRGRSGTFDQADTGLE
jgi:predicted XRE-type DNA-binding protein